MADPRVLLDTAIAARYVLERELGRGGMATVYRAVDLKHGRAVALKILRPEVAGSVGAERFLREIQVLSRLAHPHLVPLLDSGDADGVLFFVMPLVEGETLRERLRREPQLPTDEAVHIARELADAIDYAHSHGVIHRDIKPENILLTAGHAVLADFGIAWAVSTASETDRLTDTGLALGTPAYMSPEQAASGSHVDSRADLYSLGCVVYEMLTGEPPFHGSTPQAVLARHAVQEPAPIRTVRTAVPARVEAAVLRLLAKSPADRFPTASAFIAALDSGPAPTEPAISRARPPHRRKRLVLLGAMVIGILAAVVILIKDKPRSAGTQDWLLVADFLGPPNDTTLADAVRELVTVELDQSRSFATMPRQHVAAALRTAGFPDSSFITPELARELALRSSVRAVVAGSVLPAGNDEYAIVLRAVSAEDGSQIVSLAGHATPAALIAPVEKLARQLRRRLGERRDAIAANRPLEQVTTPSLPAFRKYLQGVDRIQLGDFAGGNRLLHEAIAFDSAFASAWRALGVSHVYSRNLDSARIAYARALSFPDRLTEAERYRLEADAAYAIRHDLPAAISWYDLYLSENPQSAGGRNNRALYLSSLGRHAEALEEFRRAVAMNPFGPKQAQIQLLNEAAELVVLGRVREAEVVARQLEGPFSQYFALLRPAALSQWAEAERAAREATASEGAPPFLRIQAVTTRASARAARGAVAEADRLLAEAASRAGGEERRWYSQARVLLALCTERSPGSLPSGLAEDTTRAGWVLRSLWLALRGDTADAVRALDRATAGNHEPGRLGAGPLLARAAIDSRARRWRVVVDSLSPVAAAGEHDATLLDRVSSFPLRWLVADAYEGLGLPDSAAAYLELIVSPTRMPPGHFALRGIPFPYAHRRLALLYQSQGQVERARERWQTFRQSLTHPDPALRPLLAQGPGPAGPK